LIIVVAVVFATVAVGVNVYAATGAADRHAQQLEQMMPVASILDHGVFDTPLPAGSPHESPSPARSNAPDDSCAPSDVCGNPSGNTPDPDRSNHGRTVSAFAAHIGYLDGVDGPPGALVRVIAHPDADGPPRSDRAEERRNTAHPSPQAPTAKDKDKSNKDKNG
jgi:hypothetical protein